MGDRGGALLSNSVSALLLAGWLRRNCNSDSNGNSNGQNTDDTDERKRH